MTIATDVAAEAGAAVILAAGGGELLRSERPRVLHRAGGRALVAWVVAAAREAGCTPIHVVVGSGEREIREVLEQEGLGGEDVLWVKQRAEQPAEQPEEQGTGQALLLVRELLGSDSPVLVLSGDAPLIRPATLRKLLDSARSGWGSVAVADLDKPGSPGHYALPVPAIFDWLEKLDAEREGSRLCLADAVTAAALENPVACVRVEDASEALGVNSRAKLAAVQRVLYRRSVDALLEAGVTILDPGSVWVDAGVMVGPDSVLHPGVTLLGASRVGRGCTVHCGAWLRDSVLADGVDVLPYSVLDGARVGSGCSVGPFARLRPEAVLDEGVRVGNFVEVKKSTLGPGVKASHLSYLGDSSIGAGANIGAGVITCNYDGKTKNRTVIGEGAFVGSDTILIAPVEVGAGSYTGAGSVITKDVPEETLAVGRARQKNIKRRPR